jgi:hypothetical protein
MCHFTRCAADALKRVEMPNAKGIGERTHRSPNPCIAIRRSRSPKTDASLGVRSTPKSS